MATRFTVLDVGHGSCSYLIADNSNLMLFDCGHKTTPETRPSAELVQLGQRSVELSVISNYDEDHISDLPYVRNRLDVKQLHRNKSITAAQLRALKLRKSGEISPAMESMLDMMESYSGGPLSPPPQFPGVTRTHFQNSHPFGDGLDTNNISVVTLLTVGGDTILIPGDMEREGWLALLVAHSELRARLREVTIFLASHHGRLNGYCEEMFTEHGCRPAVFVFSDDRKQYETQDTDALYRQWATGTTFNGDTRKILTTRRDGTLTWTW